MDNKILLALFCWAPKFLVSDRTDDQESRYCQLRRYRLRSTSEWAQRALQ
jgi:hypothetical protein